MPSWQPWVLMKETLKSSLVKLSQELCPTGDLDLGLYITVSFFVSWRLLKQCQTLPRLKPPKTKFYRWSAEKSLPTQKAKLKNKAKKPPDAGLSRPRAAENASAVDRPKKSSVFL